MIILSYLETIFIFGEIKNDNKFETTFRTSKRGGS